MAGDRLPIPLPVGGLSDDDAASAQQPGTTREAVNARGIDCTDGERRISQRAGSSKLTSTQIAASKIDLVEPITYDQTKVRYTQLIASFGPEWAIITPPGNGAYSPRVDRQGNVFVLARNGTCYKYNSAGTQVAVISPPIPSGFSAVPVMRLDEIDGVYLAATNDTGDIQGYIWRYSTGEDSEGNTVYRLDWEIPREKGIVDFDVRLGLMACLSDGLDPETNPARLHLYGSVFSKSPYTIWKRTTASPANAVRISSKGDVFVTCEPNPDRGYTADGDGDWESANVQWSPHEEFESETRLHSWLDAKQIFDHADNEELRLWEDRRFIATDIDNLLSPSNHLQYGQPGSTDSSDLGAHSNEPTDSDASRFTFCFKDDANITGYLNPPRFRIGRRGSLPSIEFDASSGTGSVSGNRLSWRPGVFPFKDALSSDPPNSDGTNASYHSILPGHDAYMASDGNGHGNGYTFVVCGVHDSDTLPQVVWTTSRAVSGGRLELALTANARYRSPTADWEYDAGRICFTVQRYNSDGSTGTLFSNSISRADWDRSGRGFFVASFIHGGVVSGTGRDHEHSFRVNGWQVRLYPSLDPSQQLGQPANPAAAGAWGGPGARDDSVDWTHGVCPQFLNAPVTGSTGLTMAEYSFDGALFEEICFFHPDDGTAANGLDTVTSFGAGWGAVQPYAGGSCPAIGAESTGTMQPSTYGASPTAYTQAATTVERLEGYMAHGYGSPDALRDVGADTTTDGFYDSHPFGSTRVPVGTTPHYNGYISSADNKLNQPEAIIAKYSSVTGDLVWAENVSGAGYGLALDADDNPMTIGPSGSADSIIMRKARDDGAAVGLSGANTWTISASTADDEPGSRLVRLESDSHGDLYWPVYEAGGRRQSHLRKYDKDDGTKLFDMELGDDVVPWGLAFPQDIPLYDDDAITGPEFCYLGTSGGADQDKPTLRKMRLVEADQVIDDDQTLRRNDLVTIAQGTLKVVDALGNVTTPTGGTACLLQRTPYIQGVQLNGLFFASDGESTIVYDPRERTVENLEPNDGGELPKRSRILTAWNGRLIKTRSADDPYEIYASELGNPLGWDRFPGAPSTTQAWSFRSAGIGQAPDIVNAFIPLTADLALVGMDHSIDRLTGDPAAGGTRDVLTDQVGIAFGNAWTKDPKGRLWFFSSRGGVFVTDGASMERVSETRIERRLQDLSLRDYQVRLVWDYRREGLIVLPVTATIGGAFNRAWFFEAKTSSWWEDDWTSTGVQPSAICTFDGDAPDDRKIVMGCEDGYLRFIDEDSANDDMAAIDFRVLAGPLVPPGTDARFRFTRPRIVLASDQDGCDYELYASAIADERGDPWALGTVAAGFTGTIPARTRGNAVWLRLRNNRLGERCSVEEATIASAPAGRAR